MANASMILAVPVSVTTVVSRTSESPMYRREAERRSRAVIAK